MRAVPWIVLLAAGVMLLAGCGSSDQAATEGEPTLLIGGIPDQDRSFLEERFGAVADHLSDEVGIPVAYQPSTDYAAVVTAFHNGDVQLGWFGGFTGVQARSNVDGAEAIAQRELDAEFHSVVVASSELGAESLSDLTGNSFTFGSESSTSGHLMPRHYLGEAGVDPDEDFPTVGYSGSHDTTAQQVAAGSFDAGALNATVWDRLVEAGEIDTDRVEVVERVGPYYDYNWTVHPQVNEVYGDGTIDEIRTALTSLHETEGGGEILDMFEAERFVATENANYDVLEQVARDLDMLE